MFIYVKRANGQSVKIEVESSDTIDHVRKLSGATMKLIFAGQSLIDCKTLGYYNIHPDSSIHEVFGLRIGGGSPEEYKVAEEKAEDCPICLDKLLIDTLKIPCSVDTEKQHEFHRSCISKWIREKMNNKENITCPLCRIRID